MSGDWTATRRVLLQRATVAAVAAGAGGFAPPKALATAGTAQRRRRQSAAAMPFGTELEYYRSDPADLEARLAVCAAAGYRTIQTYVPWNVHESSRGRLDFAGRTHPLILSDHLDEYQIETPDREVAAGGASSRVIANTDLLRYIDACRRHGFQLILRPGPFISDEWRNGGLPDWLAEAYPNMFMLGPHRTSLEPGFPFSPPLGSLTGGGPLFYFAGPSYASGDYLREARRWLGEFAAAVRPHLASRGGPVSSIQVDDEICFYYRFGPFEVDYHPAMLARFAAAAPTDWPPVGGPVTALLPALQWQRFKARQLAVFLQDMAGALRSGGIDVPITHEEELQLAPPANLAQIAGAVDVLHPEFYLDPGAWSVPTIELCAAAVRGAQRQQREVIAAEMSGGDVFARHLLLGEGVGGFLGFTYTEGIADADVGDMSVFGRALRLAGARLARSDRVADTAIVWPSEYLYAPYDSTTYGFRRDVRGAIESDIPALATLLVRAGLAFDLLDTDVARPQDYRRYRTIWLACADVLPRRAQQALVAYVKAGGRLICWPAPPELDEDYAPCTLLRDALFPEALGPRYSDDAQTVEVMGHQVEVWRGVQTFRLSRSARAIAKRGAEVCGYSRRAGRGQAMLLGSWPAADSVPGRIGDVLASQNGPFPGLPRPAGAGEAQKLLLFEYANERRGGEVITGGTVAYWDGENVVPVTGVNLADTFPGTAVSEIRPQTPPFRPIGQAHLKMARALHGRRPACEVSDPRVQARLLLARDSTAATLSLVNRYEQDIRVSVQLNGGRERTRLPLAGELTLPASSALLLPVEYDLAPGVMVEQATVQLLDASILGPSLTLAVTSPAGGEIVVQLPGRLTSARVNGRPAAHSQRAGYVKIAVPAGDVDVVLRWRPGRPSRSGPERTPR